MRNESSNKNGQNVSSSSGKNDNYRRRVSGTFDFSKSSKRLFSEGSGLHQSRFFRLGDIENCMMPMKIKENQNIPNSGRIEDIDLPETGNLMLEMREKYGLPQMIGGLFAGLSRNIVNRVCQNPPNLPEKRGD